ncbi:hypothetical protein ACRAWB_15300 [Leifsonia poae]|uniref:hypothetical protein n=1 Tax=Leifsonia poae TaxID=110933 RepID=UPI003D695F85
MEQDVTRLRVGGASRVELRAALLDHGVALNEYAETLLGHPVFDLREGEDVDIVVRTVGELGFTTGAVLPEVHTTAIEQGLTLCPADTGPYLRLAMTSQRNAPDIELSAGRSPAGSIKVAAPRLVDDPSFPAGFYLRVVDGQSWLRGFRCDDEYLFPPDASFAFRLP